MTNLIRTEWLKMKGYPAFWWILGITALAYPAINYGFFKAFEDLSNNPTEAAQMAKMLIGNPFSFPEAWHTVAFASSLFTFIPAVVVIMFISNEYTYRTHRQNIIDGWSRSQFVTSKLIDVLIISLIITALYFSIALVTGINNQERLIKNTWGQSYYIGLFALQTFAQLSIAFLYGFLIRKAFLALGIFLFQYMILENILVAYLNVKSHDEGRFLPIEMSDRLIPRPAFMARLNPERYKTLIDAIPQHVVMTVIFTGVIWAFCYWMNKRRDLK
ncbi:MAG TPA: ABC transporter permease [Chitinophagaceae bacterium]|nr:ABC transporter permease [Chitinophagaceae bacterium]